MMNVQKNKTALATGALAIILALSPATSFSEQAKTMQNAEKKLEQIQQDKSTEKRKEILSEATAALRETQNALKALDDNNTKDALAALERASGKLNIILVREPSLALAPVGVDSTTYDVLATVDAVKELRKKAENALEDGRLQDARRLVEDLASETVISVSNIPLATYPDAIKAAVRLIDEDKPEAAKTILHTALNTLVVNSTIIPLPVYTADQLLKDAEPLAEKADRNKVENEMLADLVKNARAELRFAEALGYGSKKDFKNLYEQLDQIEEKTKDGKSGSGFFTKLKGYLKDTVQSSQMVKPGQ